MNFQDYIRYVQILMLSMIWLSIAIVFFIFQFNSCMLQFANMFVIVRSSFFFEYLCKGNHVIASSNPKFTAIFFSHLLHCLGCFHSFRSISETVFLLFCKQCLDPLAKTFSRKLSSSLLNNNNMLILIVSKSPVTFLMSDKDESDQRSCSLDQHL